MEYKGFKLQIDEDIEYGEYGPEKIKLFFHVTTPENKNIFLDWSSWGEPMTQEIFELWVNLGCPDRHHPALEFEGKFYYSPLNRDDLEKIKVA